MFNNLRRPVPSKAALKVLYQLAYISSGTAVGIATLCTEERRRQAQIVQKIADNAKRIRQSPRYVHNAAAARREEAENAKFEGEGEQVKEKEKKKRRSVRDPDLPSAVARGYEQLVSRDYKRVRRRQTPSVTIEKFKDRDQERGTVQSRKRYGDESGVVRRRHDSNQLFRVYKRMRHSKELRVAGEIEDVHDRTFPPALKHIWQESAEKKLFDPEAVARTPRSVSRDSALFFQSQPWSMSGIPERKIAQNLLLHALQCGTLVEVRSLYRWLIARDALTSSHVIALCEACHDLAERSDHERLFDFYESLLATAEFRGLPELTMIRHCLDVAEETLHWELKLPRPQRPKICSKTLQTTSLNEALAVLHECLDETLLKMNIARATNLCFLVPYLQKRVPSWHALKLWKLPEWLNARAKVISSALDHRQLRFAYEPLHLELRHRPESALPHLERFALICEEQRSYRYLFPLLDDELVRQNIDELSPQLSNNAKAAIATACVADFRRPANEELFERLSAALPQSMSTSLLEAQTTTSLLKTWRTTRFFATAWDEYISVRQLAVKNGMPTLRSAVDLTMIDICNAANRPDRALELLADLNQRVPHSSRSLSSAAVSLAKRDAWSRLKKLLKLLQDSGSFVQDGAISRSFDHIIHLFARRHTAAETWNFVTDLMEKLQFVPTWSTTQTVLQAFVRKKHLSFVAHWVRYLKTLGHHVEMDARTAAGLVNTYYLEQRPPHVLVMWFCRKIMKLSPALESSEFHRVVTEAIGWDLRNGNQDVREKALKDLKLYRNSKEVIPKPANDMRESPSDSDLEIEASTIEPSSSEADLADANTAQFEPQVSEVYEEGQDSKAMTKTDHDAHTERPVTTWGTPAHNVQSPNSLQAARTSEEQYFDMIRDFNTKEDVPSPIADGQSNYLGITDPVSFGLEPVHEEVPASDVTLPDDLSELEIERAERARDSHRRRVEGDMVLAFSLQEYDRILELYTSSLSADGFPISPRALEITVEASLRLRHGDRSEVDGILAKARDAGMNVSCALGPLLLHHMNHLDPHDKRDANKLRLMAMEYYRSNEENGWPVSNHLVVMAAKTLINNHRPEYGINLLSDMSQSKWIQDEPLDIVAMTVFLQGYAAMKSAKGIRWTIETVLKKNMLIDKRFIRAIKHCAKHFEIPNSAKPMSKPNTRPNHLRQRLRVWHQICARQRMQQRHESKVFGRNLVKFIVKLSNQSHKPVIESDVRRELEGQLFGTSLLGGKAAEPLVSVDRVALRRARGRVARSIGWDRGPRPEGRRTADLVRDSRWLRQYRSFLRRDIVMPDGKLASFRLRLANVPRWKQRSGQRRRVMMQTPDFDSVLDVKESGDEEQYSPFREENLKQDSSKSKSSEVKQKEEFGDETPSSYSPFGADESQEADEPKSSEVMQSET